MDHSLSRLARCYPVSERGRQRAGGQVRHFGASGETDHFMVEGLVERFDQSLRHVRKAYAPWLLRRPQAAPARRVGDVPTDRQFQQ
jgi:hypothetical protein